jgi:DNA recombination protein RmuC
MNLTDGLLIATLAISFVTALFAMMAYLNSRTTSDDLTIPRAAQLLRGETEIVRGSIESESSRLRQELMVLLAKSQETMLSGFNGLRSGIEAQVRDFRERLESGVLSIDQKTDGIVTKLNSDMERMRSESVINRDNLRTLLEQKLDQNLAGHAEAAKTLKDELSDNFHRLGIRVGDSLSESSQTQNERLVSVTSAIASLSERLERALEGLRITVESRLETIRTDNAEKLERMRATVEEKLHDTLEQRLASSFKVVSDQLEQVFRGLGEMQTLATGVGDLKRMMTNVRTRGTWGEVTLANILEHAMASDQYEKNVEIRPASNQRVEFAIKLPGGEGGQL